MNKKNNKIIVFAIPTYNEADTIAPLVRIIDSGLSQYFKNHQSVIVCADQHSPDNTKRAFLKTPTNSKKLYLGSDKKGKGVGMRMVFEYVKQINADAVGFIDGDVTSATPEWVEKLISPILGGHDHVIPLYLRNEYDGSITNNLVYPILYGLLKADIRQPLAGEIALSYRAVKSILSQQWYHNAYLYGVDIFLVTQSIFNDFKIAQTFLGIKDHKPSAPKLNNMFVEVGVSLFHQLRKNQSKWKNKKLKEKRIAYMVKRRHIYHAPELAFDYKRFKEMTWEQYDKYKSVLFYLFPNFKKDIQHAFGKNNMFFLSSKLWVHILYDAIKKDKTLTKEQWFAIRVLFFARFLSFYKETIDKTHDEADAQIQAQAKLFRAMRNLSLK